MSQASIAKILHEEMPIDVRLFEVLPPLRDKCILELVNGLEGAKGHIGVQCAPTNFLRRALNCFSGKSAQRQAEVNASFAKGFDATVNWLLELTQDQTWTHQCLTQMVQKVNGITEHIAALAEYSSDTRKKLENLARNLESSHMRLEEQIGRVDLDLQATKHVGRVFDAWKAGKYHTFSPAGRLYAALANLDHGDFGYYYKNEKDGGKKHAYLDQIIDKAKTQLSAELSEQAPDLTRWLKEPEDVLSGSADALQFLAEHASCEQPFTFIIAHPTERLNSVPRFFRPERISRSMVYELFPQQENGYA